MNGFLNIVQEGELLPFQLEGNYFNIILEERLSFIDKLPTFFTDYVNSTSQITSAQIYSVDYNLALSANTVGKLNAARTLFLNIINPETYILFSDKSNKRTFYSDGFESLTKNLTCGWYRVEFTDGTTTFVSDLFFADGENEQPKSVAGDFSNTEITFDSTIFTWDIVPI